MHAYGSVSGTKLYYGSGVLYKEAAAPYVVIVGRPLVINHQNKPLEPLLAQVLMCLSLACVTIT